ncbi:MAG UNVERIFIED_CONTAM: hypothetical protein LVR18_36985 [Planctomycetaceae bacterium]|jgi:hypothetical protein
MSTKNATQRRIPRRPICRKIGWNTDGTEDTTGADCTEVNDGSGASVKSSVPAISALFVPNPQTSQTPPLHHKPPRRQRAGLGVLSFTAKKANDAEDAPGNGP